MFNAGKQAPFKRVAAAGTVRSVSRVVRRVGATPKTGVARRSARGEKPQLSFAQYKPMIFDVSVPN
jgi:hypothetical protein